MLLSMNDFNRRWSTDRVRRSRIATVLGSWPAPDSVPALDTAPAVDTARAREDSAKPLGAAGSLASPGCWGEPNAIHFMKREVRRHPSCHRASGRRTPTVRRLWSIDVTCRSEKG